VLQFPNPGSDIRSFVRIFCALFQLHEKKFRKIKGHREIPIVMAKLSKIKLDDPRKVA
jgi:hypothetical protein